VVELNEKVRMLES